MSNARQHDVREVSRKRKNRFPEGLIVVRETASVLLLLWSLWGSAMYRPSVSLVLLLALSVACPQAASSASSAPQSAYPRADDNLAFGFDRLRWGMSGDQVRLAYPDLHFTVSVVGPAALQTFSLSLDSYQRESCTFRVGFSFFRARLYAVDLHSTQMGDALTACRRQTRRELTQRYGASSASEWPLPVTTTRYIIPFAVPIPAPRPAPLDISVTDARDVSGYKAYLVAEDKKCHSITVEISADASLGAISDPVLAPREKDLGCDYYPDISYRLQEQGAVLLEADILADGTVGNVAVVSSGSRKRLNAAAIDIVEHHVTISPATKDGKEIEARCRITVTFKLTHLIRGRQ
jgi:TonB family protein